MVEVKEEAEELDVVEQEVVVREQLLPGLDDDPPRLQVHPRPKGEHLVCVACVEERRSACWFKMENPQLWGGLRRDPEATAKATASLQERLSRCSGVRRRGLSLSEGQGRRVGRRRQTRRTGSSNQPRCLPWRSPRREHGYTGGSGRG